MPATQRWIRRALIAALFVTLAVVNSLPLAFHPSSRIGEHGDALFSVWRLAWVAHQLRANPLRLFDANIFYPEPRTLAYSDAILLPAITVAPLHWGGVEPVTVYTLTLLLAFVLNGLSACALAHRLTGSTAAGILSGVVFGFAPFRFDHFDHLEMQFSFWLPLALLAWHRAVAAGTTRSYLRVAGLAACQVLSCIYYGIFLLTWLPVVTAVWFFRTPRAAIKACALMLLPPLAVLAIYSVPYLLNRDRLGERPRRDVVAWSARAGDFLTTPPTNVVFGGTATRSVPERRLFPGITATVLLIVALWPPWDRIRAVHAAGLGFALQLALGFNGFVYRVLYDWVLPYRGLRVPARAYILVLLGVSILAGYGVARVTARFSRRVVAGAVSAVLVAMTCAEYFSRPALKTIDTHVSAWYGSLSAMTDAVLFEWPVTVPWRFENMVDVDYMYRSTRHWRPLVNGYSGNYPASYVELLLTMRTFPDTGSLQYLQRAGATVLVVHEVEGSRPSFEYAVDRLTRDPNVRVLAQDVDGDGRVMFFRLSPAGR
jgi:hypothetical protein